MTEFKKNYCLRDLNTFGIAAKTKYFAEFDSLTTLKKILDSTIYNKNNVFILGEGSNILLTQDFDGLILKNKIIGISILKDDKDSVTVEVGAGVNWHEFVKWSVRKKLSGIENLALIPGTVGASPIQNIGAYGMEVKDTITKVHAFSTKDRRSKIYKNEDCKFEYRNSIFKLNLKNKIIISKVEFKLSKIPLNKIAYGAIQNELNS